MNVMDIMQERTSAYSKNVKAIAVLADGKEYKIQDMCELGYVNKDRKALFFRIDGCIYGGYTDGEKYEDEDGQVYFNIKKDQDDLCSLSIPEKHFYGWTYEDEYTITTWRKIKNFVKKLGGLNKK